MARANPPPIKVPKDEKLSPTLWRFLDKLAYSVYLLWVRSGKGGDTLEIVTKSEALETSAVYAQSEEQFADVEQIEDFIPTVIPKEWCSVEKSEPYTAIDRDFVEATKRAHITLDDNAEFDDEIIVANGDGTRIKITGSIKVRKLESSLLMIHMGTSLHFKRFNEYWRLV